MSLDEVNDFWEVGTVGRFWDFQTIWRFSYDDLNWNLMGSDLSEIWHFFNDFCRVLANFDRFRTLHIWKILKLLWGFNIFIDSVEFLAFKVQKVVTFWQINSRTNNCEVSSPLLSNWMVSNIKKTLKNSSNSSSTYKNHQIT